MRLHWIFLIWAAFEFFQANRFGGLREVSVYLAMLFGSVFLHEMGHCRSARQVGGAAREVILWPLGGLASVDVPGRPLAHLAVAAGGPIVNLVLWLALLPFVISMDASIGSFLLWPAAEPITEPVAVAAAVNLDLLLFNLLPAFPLDGGRILHAVLWQRSGEGAATRVAARSGKLVGVALAVIWFISDDLGGLVLAIALLIWIQSHQMQQMAEESFSSESWQGGASSGPNWWQRQRDNFQHRRQQKKLRQEQELRSRVDALLEKVSRDGIESLSREERHFLDRASQRFEDR